MEIKKQVVSLSLAKRLKELGVKQESLFWYEQVKVAGLNQWEKDYQLGFNNNSAPYHNGERIVSTFTVAELGELLPSDHWTQKAQEGGWKTKETISMHSAIAPMFFEDTEAEARAKILIYLLESNILKESPKEQLD